jgi:transcriptional regulator with XRE-family HTH domain
MSTLGERAKRARKDLGYNQKDFAEATGFSAPYLSKVENDIHTPRTDLMILLAKSLGVSLEWLVGMSDDPTPR